MEDLENKLGAILGNPEMMQKIMSMAQSLGGGEGPRQETPKQEAPRQDASAVSQGFGDIDLGMIRKLSGFAKNSGIDKNQQSLLRALSPYLSSQRVSRLERAMRAAKMASFATSFLGTGR